MQLFAGTSGYSFKEWRGRFYPEQLSADGMLRYYAQQLPTVEINSSFYGLPREDVLARWRDDVPDGFVFALKAPRRITHEKRLREAGDDATELFRRAAVLGTKLGAVLFQLPPSLKKDLPRLRGFVDGLPGGAPVAFEFRHASWQDDEVYAALRERGVALCVADTDDGDTPFIATSDRAYVRLRRTHYDDAELRTWAERIAERRLARTYVYFMHEDEALGTRFAQRLLALWSAVA